MHIIHMATLIVTDQNFRIKVTLMQIWKSFYMFQFIQKHRENVAFLILRILELFARKACEMFVYKHTETIEYVKK